MKKQITHISLHQTAKVLAIMIFIFSAVFLIPMGIISLFTPDRQAAAVLFILPFIYFAVSYVTWYIWGWLYNLVASHFGGIEYDVTNKE